MLREERLESCCCCSGIFWILSVNAPSNYFKLIPLLASAVASTAKNSFTKK